MVDKNTIRQVLGGLMHSPQFLSETDKYTLITDDFSSIFEKTIYAAIFNLYQNGAEKITSIDVDNYLDTNPASKALFQQNNGIEYLEDIYELAQVENFSFYYNRLKKLNAIRDLKELGFDTSSIYAEDLLNKNAKEINDAFEEKTIADIFDAFKVKLVKVESKYHVSEVSAAVKAGDGIRELIAELRESPDVGAPLQGDMFNTIARGARKGKFYIRSGGSGVGKALLNSTKIPTPDGWKKVGSVKEGDYLFDALGKPTKVLKVFPQGKREVWEITFGDGRVAQCDGDHLWSFNTAGQGKHSKENRVFFTETTREISKRSLKNAKNQNLLFVPANKPVEYEKKEYFISPYVFGLMLGNGSFRQHETNKSFQFSSEDDFLPSYIAKEQGWILKRNSITNFTWHFADEKIEYSDPNRRNLWVEDVLIEYPDLINKYSHEKYIPKEYLQGDVQQRFELLNGLLDSDGTIDNKGRIGFWTNSPQLRDDFIELVYSLGAKVSYCEDNRQEKTGYSLHLTANKKFKNKLFKVPHKVAIREAYCSNGKRENYSLANPIVKIEKTNQIEEMTCFLVDNEEHLFLMNDFIVTHNSRAAVGDACHLAYPVRFNTEQWKWEFSGSNERTLYISTEQEVDEIQTLIISYLTGIDEEKILYGLYDTIEQKIIEEAFQVMDYFKDNLILVLMPDPTISQLKAVVRQHVLINGIENVFYDYIHSTPSLLGEFRDLRLRTDEVLLILSTALKNLAVELGVFMMTSTQLSDKGEKGEIKNESSISGAKSIPNKGDVAVIISRVTSEEEQTLRQVIPQGGLIPNQVTDVYKVRRGKYNQVRIWTYHDLGTCRREDVFVTNARMEPVATFVPMKFSFNYAEEVQWRGLLGQLNDD